MANLKDTMIMAGYHNSRQFMLAHHADVLYDTITWRETNLADDAVDSIYKFKARGRILGVSYEKQVFFS